MLTEIRNRIQAYLHDLTDADLTGDEKRERGVAYIKEVTEEAEDVLIELAETVVPPGFTSLLAAALDADFVENITDTLASAINDAVYWTVVVPSLVKSK